MTAAHRPAALLLLLLLGCIGRSAPPPPAASLNCSATGAATMPGVEIVSAESVRAGPFRAGDGQVHQVPAFCRLVGVARPTPRSEIGFELWLPAAWNGRYVQLGNGGFAGNIDQAGLAAEIRRGNAAAMTDTGHKADRFDASWARGNPDRVIDYGYRSIKATADAARALIGAHYGAPPRRRYFVGCSNGGRQALIAAQRYPDDWDGILAGAPAVQWTRQLATFAAIQHRLRADPANWLPAAKLPAIQRAALAQCPAAASNPRACPLDTSRLRCRGGETDACLTPAQAATLDLIQSGPLGFEPTGAAIPGNWDHWIVNPDRNASSQLAFATQAFRHLILDHPSWTIDAFDPATDIRKALDRNIGGQPLPDILDADDPDLSRFAARGGRLIMYFGWADAVLSPRAGVAYYEEAAQAAGGFDRARTFFRLFMVPGMLHCQGGLAPAAFGQSASAPALRPDSRHDIRQALEAWVERSIAPDSLVAVADRGGPRAQVRMLHPYPTPPGSIEVHEPAR